MKKDIQSILESFKSEEIDLKDALRLISEQSIDEMGYATIDTSRKRRTGMPEVIYAEGKTTEQVKNIALRMYYSGSDILATRVTPEMGDVLQKEIPDLVYDELSRTCAWQKDSVTETEYYIAIVAAGTSDLPVAKEAVVTAKFLGNKVEEIYDVGVAGVHRLFHRLDTIRNARVIIVIAGMEGALASVVGGLVDKPVIGVPTSVGYGANFQGLSALLSMLNSCASGVSVVNIDNGFGAACQASMINQL